VLEDGRAVLSDGALPGDVIRLDRWFEVGELLRCASWTMIESSSERREPPQASQGRVTAKRRALGLGLRSRISWITGTMPP
jgi:hypothetical protein